jgi:predicted nucleic acid-binding Zn ribbon protein
MALTDVKEAWAELMGPAIARHTRRLRIDNKILKIEVDNAPLRQQLAMSRNRIIKLVNDKVGRNLIVDCLIY